MTGEAKQRRTAAEWVSHMSGQAQGIPPEEMVNSRLAEDLNEAHKIAADAKQAGESAKSFTEKLKALEPRQKAAVAIWAAGAAIGIVGFCTAASHSVEKDELGDKHMRWSQVGVAGLEAALTGLFSFMAIEAFHGRG